ncbi:hypothetical protein ACFE04_023140 [Oxalis oulophora]
MGEEETKSEVLKATESGKREAEKHGEPMSANKEDASEAVVNMDENRKKDDKSETGKLMEEENGHKGETDKDKKKSKTQSGVGTRGNVRHNDSSSQGNGEWEHGEPGRTDVRRSEDKTRSLVGAILSRVVLVWQMRTGPRLLAIQCARGSKLLQPTYRFGTSYKDEKS